MSIILCLYIDTKFINHNNNLRLKRLNQKLDNLIKLKVFLLVKTFITDGDNFKIVVKIKNKIITTTAAFI